MLAAMTSTFVIALVTGGLAMSVTQAEATPAWCNHRDIRRMQVPGNVKEALSADPYEAIPNLVAASCRSSSELTERANDIVAARQKWNQRLGITDDEWATDVVDYATSGAAERR